MTDIKQKVVKGLFWSTVERFSAQSIQFILGIVLARILLPSDYGLIGMLAIFLAVSQTFIDSGFGTALIQKKDRDDLDFSTTFFFNFGIASLFYILLFFFAPLIAEFYKQPILIILTRVIGLVIIINSFAVVQRTKITILLDFKTLTKASLISIIFSGGIGIYLAFTGFGVWALVWQTLIQRSIELIILWDHSKWLPRKGFSKHRFKSLFSFGSKLLASGLLDTVFRNIYLIVIGKMFSAASLGYYTRAQQFNNFPSSNITGIIQRVTFPVLSELQNDNTKLRDAYRKIIKLSALIVFPLMMGLAALAEPLIRVVLTEKWIETVWMLQLLTFAGMWYPIHALNLNVLNVKGRSDIFLKLEVAKKILVTIVLVISIPLGIKAIIIGQIITSYIALMLNTHFTKRMIDYGFLQQMKDLFKVLILSFSMGIIIHFTIMLINLDMLKLITGFAVGILFFVSIAWLFNIGEIRLLPDFIRQGK